jgi:hypothetical protein
MGIERTKTTKTIKRTLKIENDNDKSITSTNYMLIKDFKYVHGGYM